MANLKTKIADSDKTVTQTISMKGELRNKLVEEAEKNGRSLAAEIVYRTRKTFELEKQGVRI